MLKPRALPRASDPVEQDLRDRWHAAKEAWVEDGCKIPSRTRVAFTAADNALSKYLWNRTLSEIEEDRRKHPKAKRNQVAAQPGNGGRYLP